MTTGTLLSFKLEVETLIYYKFVISFVTQNPFVLNTRMNSNLLNFYDLGLYVNWFEILCGFTDYRVIRA